ncbi:(2Fe-2S)-binding protein [Chromobacterium vaccinii]|nr:(2Fe-2S)-binding protein [Chromobacterium vaccinii]QND92255.1 (2Fe-2S)-binding protein [Chromobacterium vaccinii]
MPVITLLPEHKQLELPAESPLIDLEFEYYGEQHLSFGCRSGVCGVCLVKVHHGASLLGPVAENERDFVQRMGFESGPYRLACQCRLNGDVTLEVATRDAMPHAAAPSPERDRAPAL